MADTRIQMLGDISELRKRVILAAVQGLCAELPKSLPQLSNAEDVDRAIKTISSIAIAIGDSVYKTEMERHTQHQVMAADLVSKVQSEIDAAERNWGR